MAKARVPHGLITRREAGYASDPTFAPSATFASEIDEAYNRVVRTHAEEVERTRKRLQALGFAVVRLVHRLSDIPSGALSYVQLRGAHGVVFGSVWVQMPDVFDPRDDDRPIMIRIELEPCVKARLAERGFALFDLD